MKAETTKTAENLIIGEMFKTPTQRKWRLLTKKYNLEVTGKSQSIKEQIQEKGSLLLIYNDGKSSCRQWQCEPTQEFEVLKDHSNND